MPQSLQYTPRAEMIEKNRKLFERSNAHWSKIAREIEAAVRESQRIGSDDLTVCVNATPD